MDAVILAGGKGSRLGGVMPPYWKPLLPMQGIPLVCRIVEQARGYVERTFVIVAPENALQVAQVLHAPNIFMVVQQDATGPGDALLLGLALTKADDVLVLMGDNLMPDADIAAVCAARKASNFVIGTGEVVTESEARRFTRIYDDGRHIEEGPDVSAPSNFGDPYTVWCGPLILPVEATLSALRGSEEDDYDMYGERKIGPHLQNIAAQPALVPCDAIDIGTPEAIVEVQA